MEPKKPRPAGAVGAARETPRWRRVVAFLATLFLPGVAQADNGEFRRGYLWFLGLGCLLIAGELVMYAALDRPRLGLGAVAATLIVELVLVVHLAVDGYRQERTPERRGSSRRVVAIYAAFVVAAAGFAVAREAVKARLVRAYRFSAISMEPTILKGDHVVVDRSAYRNGRHPARGDIAVFLFPEDREREFLKRVVAVPGDTVAIRCKKVLVNGREIREEYARLTEGEESFPPRRDNMPAVRLAEGQYFVLGDNRDRSYDSRVFGPIDEKDFLGKAAYVYFSADLGRIGKAIR